MSEQKMSEEQFNQLMTQMGHIDRKFEMIDRKFDKIDQRFDKFDQRFEYLEENMVRKSDVFQSVLTVQGFMFAIVVGVVVILNSVVGFG